MVTSHMSIAQIFECLRRAGCVDLSSQMDSRQDTAMIASGGGFGDIWKGKLHNGTDVAIKAWRTNTLEQCDYKTLKRAARELFLWSRMDHPHIHRLQGVILFRDQYLGMVSEWMDNGNLHEYLRKNPNADRYQFCAHVASGLEYMHTRNTVHGDLKAVNVLVSRDGAARISDFDYSILSEASSGLVFSISSSNARPATMRWAAPELLSEQTETKTTESDVYALGMVSIGALKGVTLALIFSQTMLVNIFLELVYHALTKNVQEIFTGTFPFPERKDVSVILAVLGGAFPARPPQIGDDEKGNMMWHLMSLCWNRGTSARPSSAQVVNALVFHICTM
ncbi:unnamed protein product [Rhizoctonia solani]|uniref:Protein kinase domain-containing protein n=1 Tax=Rhizoctonia solani TaxID=456999 RepID=A0A8H3HWS6_9AGAM|nr:unnamed protein product [Rhizoctonia solani]